MTGLKKTKSGGAGYVCVGMILGLLTCLGSINVSFFGAAVAVLVIYSEVVFDAVGDVSLSDPESIGEALDLVSLYGADILNTFLVWTVTLTVVIFVFVVVGFNYLRGRH